MTLEERAARMTRARPSDSIGRQLVIALALSVMAVVLAMRQDLWVLAIGAAFALGAAFRPEADRYYLEGFSDGLAALPAAGPARHGTRPAGDLDELPASAGVDGAGPRRSRSVVRPSDRGFDPPGGRDAVGDLADALGVHGVPGPPRPALDADARPLPRTRPVQPAPIVPEALRAGSVGEQAALGPAPRAEARAGGGEADLWRDEGVSHAG